MRPALVERPLCRFDNVRGSGKIRFADFQVNHTAALRFECTCADQDFKGGFDSDASHSFGKFHGGT